MTNIVWHNPTTGEIEITILTDEALQYFELARSLEPVAELAEIEQRIDAARVSIESEFAALAQLQSEAHPAASEALARAQAALAQAEIEICELRTEAEAAEGDIDAGTLARLEAAKAEAVRAEQAAIELLERAEAEIGEHGETLSALEAELTAALEEMLKRAVYDRITHQVGRTPEEHAVILQNRKGVNVEGQEVYSHHKEMELLAVGVDVPSTLEWIRSWTFGDGQLSIDMVRARGVARDVIRTERPAKFKPLDDAFMVALEKGQSTTAIAAAKQVLRDAPAAPAITDAASLADLEAALAAFRAL